jgi:ADP-heptose:LPS heptosyltransferase
MGFKNWLIKTLVPAAGKKPLQNRFLIVSTTGLGDTLWATPAIRALRKSFPDAYIACLTTSLGNEILKNNRHLDEIFILKKPHFFSLVSLFFRLSKRNISQILLFHASQRMVFPFCALLRPSRFIGTYGQNKGLDALFTKALSHPPVHEIERRLRIVREVGAHPLDSSLELFLTQEDEKNAEAFLQKHAIASHIPLVGIHPGSKDEFKRWGDAEFATVGSRLVDHLGCQVIVTGNREEETLVRKVASKIPGALAIAGELNLGTLAALIRKFSLMICNDTGPMHLSFAMQTPTVALFGPTDPALCGPHLAKRTRTLAKGTTCRPCLRKKCQEPFCLLQIGPEEVYDAATELFYERRK